MRIRRSASPDGEPVIADADGQAAWDDDAAPGSGRRHLIAAAALGLAALLLLAVFAASRTGPEGDILALGPAEDPNGLPPVDDLGLLDEGGSGGQSQVTPGDSIPAAPGAGDPAAAAAAGGATAGGGTAGGGTAGAPGGGATPAGGGGPAAAPAGPGPGQAIPVLTTRPGSTGAPTTAGPGTTQPPGPPPPCAITNVSVNPNPINRNARGQKTLVGDVRVTFRPASSCSGPFRVRVNDPALDLLAFPTVDGFYDAIIRGYAERWEKGDHTITISGGGATATAVLTVSN